MGGREEIDDPVLIIRIDTNEQHAEKWHAAVGWGLRGPRIREATSHHACLREEKPEDFETSKEASSSQ